MDKNELSSYRVKARREREDNGYIECLSERIVRGKIERERETKFPEEMIFPPYPAFLVNCESENSYSQIESPTEA